MHKFSCKLVFTSTTQFPHTAHSKRMMSQCMYSAHSKGTMTTTSEVELIYFYTRPV